MSLIKNRMIIKCIQIFNLLFLAVIFCFGCQKENKIEQTKRNNEINHIDSEINTDRQFSLKDFLTDDSILNSKVDFIFNTLNDSEKVAQMIFASAGNNGKPFETVNRLILNKKIGGVIIMGGSKDSYKQIINKFDTAVKKSNCLPLFYAADAEPGFIESRIQNTVKFPPQSRIKTKQDADTIANKISKILKDLKININFAPVCDISINKDIIGDRSYGSDKRKIIELSTAFINSTQKNNIIATAKHFPGHGNVNGDSHKELVYIDGELAEVETFQSVIKEGVSAVMVGHIAVKNNKDYKTDGLPASLSRKIVTDLLRNKIGFKGLIITDALNMGALLKFDRPALNAAMAGCDILLMPTDELKLLNAIITEANKNPEFKKQIDNSVKRIIKAKICLGLIKT
jgi:beta-N-acetylhexosaminidase